MLNNFIDCKNHAKRLTKIRKDRCRVTSTDKKGDGHCVLKGLDQSVKINWPLVSPRPIFRTRTGVITSFCGVSLKMFQCSNAILLFIIIALDHHLSHLKLNLKQRISATEVSLSACFQFVLSIRCEKL